MNVCLFIIFSCVRFCNLSRQELSSKARFTTGDCRVFLWIIIIENKMLRNTGCKCYNGVFYKFFPAGRVCQPIHAFVLIENRIGYT